MVEEEADRPALEIIRALPNGRHYPAGGETVLDRLIGATILEIGSYAEDHGIDGGGLVIEYIKAGVTGRLVLALGEQGAWVERDELVATRA